MDNERINQEEEAVLSKCKEAFRSLFQAAKKKDELQFALALSPEHRGMQDAGWNTAEEADRAFHDYMPFVTKKKKPSSLRIRVALGFYCHLAEASGFYETPKNMLLIADGKKFNMWPFSALVDAHKQSGAIISPNANKVFKDLIGHAATLGFADLAEVFRDAFDSDIRNAYAHADYVIWQDGLRLPKRNGGHADRIEWPEFNRLFMRGTNFYITIKEVVDEHVKAYDPPKTIRAVLSDEPEGNWTIHYDKNRSSFRISNTV